MFGQQTMEPGNQNEANCNVRVYCCRYSMRRFGFLCCAEANDSQVHLFFS